ncbi:uncharacterized protein LOC128680805 [Plodia interpunctella]|uniref:uncharacterized protein LOC128680805 n=1 Tax=Plodia interpunctella TaxID=58824 RepID=UPI0023681BC3|nr:uncharacterized protein LOC128680805 [Plodia interpunctella]
MDVRIFVAILVVGGTYAISGKGFYCRDPDTGKLHSVNTTWKSTTFCGNYTCRLKRKDIIASPLREFKISEITSVIQNKSNDIKDSGQDDIIAANPLNVNVKQKDDKNITDLISNILNNITEPNDKMKIGKMGEINKTDRYLNEKEIKLISDLLHGVKKSDLETVVDIYNIAQDIYKELDKKTSDPNIEDTLVQQKEDDTLTDPMPLVQQQMVYGIEPMQYSQKSMTDIKNPESEILPDAVYHKLEHNELTDGYESMIPEKHEKEDMHKEGSDVMPTLYLTPKFDEPAPTYISPIYSSPSYVKLPYFYQMTDFQRKSSYVHPHSSVETERTLLQPITGKPVEKTTSKPVALKNFNAHQPILLPYPYYQVRYNASGYPFNYFYGVNPYQDVYRKQYNPYYVTRTSYADQMKSPERSYAPGTLIDTLLPKDDTKTSKAPEWKTESLSDDVLDEIRAHFENKNILFKPICLKKKIKLDKVGKVFKLDDFRREKRSVEENTQTNVNKTDDYEVYVERIICQSDVDPGFFRMGNTSAPFPACCPQRIR